MSPMTTVERQIADARKNARTRARMDQQRASMLLVRDLTAAFEASGLGLRELARSMDTSPSQVRRILEGETDIGLSTLWRFVRAMGCTFELKVSRDQERVQPEVPEATQAKMLAELAAVRKNQGELAKLIVGIARAQDSRMNQLESGIRGLQWRLEPGTSEGLGLPAGTPQRFCRTRTATAILESQEGDVELYSLEKKCLS